MSINEWFTLIKNGALVPDRKKPPRLTKNFAGMQQKTEKH